MKKENDILSSNPELKEMPFKLPDGYFDSIRRDMKSSVSGTDVRKTALWQKIAPVLSMAAGFAMIAFVGTTVIGKMQSSDEMDMEDYYVHSGVEAMSTVYDMYDSRMAEAQVSSDDVIEYLLYSGITAETIGQEQ